MTPISGMRESVVDSDGRCRVFIYVKCGNCSVLFLKRESFVVKHGGLESDRHFCGVKCAVDDRKRRVIVGCAYCGVDVERKLSQVNDKLTFCCVEHKNAAQIAEVGILKCGPNYGEAVSSYRVKAFRYYGPNPKCEWCNNNFDVMLDVHHIDGNRENAEYSNLIILCVYCHALITRKVVLLVDRRPQWGCNSAIECCSCEAEVEGLIPSTSTT